MFPQINFISLLLDLPVGEVARFVGCIFWTSWIFFFEIIYSKTDTSLAAKLAFSCKKYTPNSSAYNFLIRRKDFPVLWSTSIIAFGWDHGARYRLPRLNGWRWPTSWIFCVFFVGEKYGWNMIFSYVLCVSYTTPPPKKWLVFIPQRLTCRPCKMMVGLGK